MKEVGLVEESGILLHKHVQPEKKEVSALLGKLLMSGG